MDKKYCYMNVDSADDGSLILKYDEKRRQKSEGGEMEHIETRYESHVEIFPAADLSTDEGLKALGAKIKEIATAKL